MTEITQWKLALVWSLILLEITVKSPSNHTPQKKNTLNNNIVQDTQKESYVIKILKKKMLFEISGFFFLSHPPLIFHTNEIRI